MARKRDDLPRKQREYRKESEGKMNVKKCPHCGNAMRYKGPKDSAGTMYWKCRNKTCGRTVSLRKDPPKPIVPLTYLSRI